jgi:hypothetical protein
MQRYFACLAIFLSAMLFIAPLQINCGGLLNRIRALLRPADADIDVNTGVNETFTIELEQALNPNYEWKCTEYEKNYVELLDEGLRSSSDPERMGVTVKYFTFRAINRGSTELRFAYGSIDAEGNLKEITQETSRTVKIN